MHVCTITIHFDEADEVTHPETGTISLGGGDHGTWIRSDSPAAWESLAAHCLTTANALRVPGGAA